MKAVIEFKHIDTALKCTESYELAKRKLFDHSNFIEVTNEKRSKILIAKDIVSFIYPSDNTVAEASTKVQKK